MTFKLMRGIAGGWVATTDGLAKSGGLILHGAVFVLVILLLMKRKSGGSSKMHSGGIQGMDV